MEPRRKRTPWLGPIQVTHISAVGFYQNLVQPNTITFTTSLYKIN